LKHFVVHREKIRYLEEGGEETADIQAKYPREPPEIAPPQFTKDQVSLSKNLDAGLLFYQLKKVS
jgi:hypothetical protein